jgi:hypothetical protein
MKLQASYETDLYISASNYFAISQKDQFGEESIVLFSPGQLESLLFAVQKAIETKDQWAAETTQEGEGNESFF